MISRVQILHFIIFAISITLAVVFWVPGHNLEAETLSDTKAQQEVLQDRLKEIQKQIDALNKELVGQKGQSASIQSEIAILKNEIDKTRLEIDKKNNLIKQLSSDISSKAATITQLNQELGREQASLGQLLRRMNELDSVSLLEVVLSKESISDYFIDLDSFNSIQAGLQDSFETIKVVQTKTDEEKRTLEEKKIAEADIKAALEQDRRKVESKKSEQDSLLQVSKTKEKTFEQIIAERQAEAARIRARLFELAGGIQGGGISFGDAVEYAEFASSKTGVRPALILAILSQESDLGKNVGTCNRPGDSRTWRDIMPGPGQSWRDDQAAFLQIMSELGLPPDGQPLSCPLASGGWGGAMGPSQFIPTTWLGVRDSVEALLGVSLANPWNPRHAVMATAVYMRDLGAAAGGYTAEVNAACKYYSGRACGQSSQNNTFYGDSVIGKANAIQQDIDFLEGRQSTLPLHKCNGYGTFSLVMKKDIHPESNRKVIFLDVSSNEQFLVSSTVATEETGKWTDGKEYPLYRVEISSASHPFYTGNEKSLDTAGRAEKFRKRAAKAKTAKA